MDNYSGKNITVFGLARSGAAAAKKLAQLGAKVLVSELRPEEKLDAARLAELRSLGVELELGGHTDRAIASAELVVVSPGLRLDIPVLIEAKRRGVPIISEIELAYRLLSKPIIAVTGTNGKTTTATLIGELLKAGGKQVAVAGNIGRPLVEVEDGELDYIVAEVSSYQLETIAAFRPWIGLLLNVQPDHLERHGSMEGYIEQKARLFLNQTGDDYLVYNQDDPRVVQLAKRARSQPIPFSKERPEIITLPPAEIRIPGRHNLENALAAAQAAYLCGITKETVAEVLRTFPGVEHRIEFVTSIDGVEFYNDSKGTNPDSTLVALETFQGRGIVLILGGRDKGVALDDLARAVKQRVKEVVLIGEAAERFRCALESAGFLANHSARSLAEAVRLGKELAGPGDVVLFSPACASFDMFDNFEQRGQVFKEEVRKMHGPDAKSVGSFSERNRQFHCRE